jgi:hypothetical protein
MKGIFIKNDSDKMKKKHFIKTLWQIMKTIGSFKKRMII